MKTIHKYVLGEHRGPIQAVSTYERARFLHVENRGGQIAVWAEVNTLERETMRTMHVVPTGGHVPSRTEYVGTALLEDGAFVLHVYAETETVR